MARRFVGVSRRRTVTASAIAVAALVTGCGGDDGNRSGHARQVVPRAHDLGDEWAAAPTKPANGGTWDVDALRTCRAESAVEVQDEATTVATHDVSTNTAEAIQAYGAVVRDREGAMRLHEWFTSDAVPQCLLSNARSTTRFERPLRGLEVVEKTPIPRRGEVEGTYLGLRWDVEAPIGTVEMGAVVLHGDSAVAVALLEGTTSETADRVIEVLGQRVARSSAQD